MTKTLSPAAVVALKEALCSIYWYKSNLRSFLRSCIADHQVIATLDWEKYKRQIVADLVDRLCDDPSKHIGDLTKLLYAVAEMKSFSHLEKLEDGKTKASNAKQAVEALKKMLEPDQRARNEAQALEERQKRHEARMKENEAVR